MRCIYYAFKNVTVTALRRWGYASVTDKQRYREREKEEGAKKKEGKHV